MSETTMHSVGSSPCITHSGEEPMLGADTVQEVLARLARGEGVKALARELGVDRKTVKRWRRLGQWRPRQGRPRPRGVDPYLERLAQRGPEVGWNAMVLHRELQGLGFSGSVQQVRRAIRPWRAEVARAAMATVRYETGPGEQAQVDFGQLRIWIGEGSERVHLFVLTLGYSRRLWVRAYPHE
jgi:transposase